MITQDEADDLLNMLKKLKSSNTILFPESGEYTMLEAVGDQTKEKFIIDLNRKGSLNPMKATYQTRYQKLRSTKTGILLRVDLGGSPHTNPDGNLIQCPHIHIYREGYEDKWAYPLDEKINTDPNNLIEALMDFLKYNKIINIPPITKPLL